MRYFGDNMQYKGTLKNWKYEQGFGFAITEENAEKVFVHIKNFSRKSRRPVEGDLLIYRLTTDGQGRKQAVDIQFLHDYQRQRLRQMRFNQQEDGKNLLSKLAAYPFMLFVLGLSIVGEIPTWVLGYYIVLNLWTFYAYWSDKRAAQQDKRRTPEDTLHLYSLLGGWMGALFAQLNLRHKSQKKAFRQTFWLTVIAHVIIFVLLVYFNAFDIIQNIWSK